MLNVTVGIDVIVLDGYHLSDAFVVRVAEGCYRVMSESHSNWFRWQRINGPGGWSSPPLSTTHLLNLRTDTCI